MAVKKDMFVEYLKKTKVNNAPPQLQGVATDGTVTLASDGYTALWHTDPLYTSLAPQLKPDVQAHMQWTIKQHIKEAPLGSVAISPSALKLLSDMMSHNKPSHVILQIRKNGANTVLLAGTRDSGMMIMPMLTGNKSHEMTKKESAPFLYWGLDEGDE